MCVKCGAALGISGDAGAKSKVAASLLGIFLGALGVHKFYLGYTKAALVMLLVSVIGGVITLGVAAWIVGLVGFIEGIIYLTKSDDDFATTYVHAERQWF